MQKKPDAHEDFSDNLAFWQSHAEDQARFQRERSTMEMWEVRGIPPYTRSYGGTNPGPSRAGWMNSYYPSVVVRKVEEIMIEELQYEIYFI